MVDVTGPEQVEVLIRNDGKVIWINVDGVCRLRCCRIVNPITITDERRNLIWTK